MFFLCIPPTGVSLGKETRLPLRLDELRCVGSRGRWWAVGSAFHGDVLQAQSGPSRFHSSKNQTNLDEPSNLSKEVCENNFS